jgi:paraquat-inducible protein B
VRTPATKFEKAAGIFVATVVALLSLAILGSGHWGRVFDVFREGYVLYAVSDEAYGAAVGSPVKVRDVDVGSVTEVTLREDPTHPGKPVRITMKIQPHAANFLRSSTVAVIVRPPFGSGMPPFGTSSVELRTDGSEPLTSKSYISAIGQPSMLEDFARMTHDVSDMRGRFADAVDEMKRSMNEMRQMVALVRDGDGIATRMLKDPALAESFAAAMNDTRKAADELRTLATDASRVTKQLPAVVDDARDTSKDARALIAKLNETADSLPAMIAATERTLKLAEELTQTLRVAVSFAPDLARKVDTSIDEANRLVEAAQRNILLRGSMPERTPRKTETTVRPLAAPGASAP